MFTYASKFPAFINRAFYYWIGRRMPGKSVKVGLSRHSTYILPTRYGVLFGIILFGMLLSSMNYSNSMGFLLTFLLAGICLTGMLHTFRNLIMVVVTAGRNAPVFAGEAAVFHLLLDTADGRPAYALSAGLNRRSGIRFDIVKNRPHPLSISVPASRRGRLQLGRIRIWSEFPLGLFHVWAWIEPAAELLVYPQPAGRKHMATTDSAGSGKRVSTAAGHDDFAGLRRYHRGDSLRHIDWKAAARGHEILTKQFADPVGDDIWLDWDSLPDLNPEQRLSQLCQWVLDLHRSNCNYGLKLPDVRIEPGRGEAHKHACLTRLALFEY